MSVNSTPSANTVSDDCMNTTLGFSVITSYGIIRSILLFPLFIAVIHTGVQRWRLKHSLASESHTDIITYHSLSLEVIRVVGFVLLCLHPLPESGQVVSVGQCLYTITWYGEILFHVLTCVERYLAVAHPVTYMGLKKERGVRIRNICIGSAWALTITSSVLSFLPLNPSLRVISLGIVVFALVSVSFCSLAVLRILIRQGPGEGGNNRERVDRTKQRAFYTIMAIFAVLWLWFFGLLSTFITYDRLKELGTRAYCVAMSSVFFLNLPSCLVLPLMYLQRTGKLPNCFRSSR